MLISGQDLDGLFETANVVFGGFRRDMWRLALRHIRTPLLIRRDQLCLAKLERMDGLLAGYKRDEQGACLADLMVDIGLHLRSEQRNVGRDIKQHGWSPRNDERRRVPGSETDGHRECRS